MTSLKHPYNPGWSWGHLIAVIAILVPMTVGGLGVYVMMRVDSAVAAEKIVTLGQKVDTHTETEKARIDKLEANMAVLSQAAEEMRVTQAVMRANIEVFMRAQGLRPLDEQSIQQPRRSR